MALIENYLIKTENLHSFLNTILTAQAPDKFTIKFLAQLGFDSSNDRLLIGLLKGLGFIDGNGVPTSRYFRFLDQSESKKVLAEAVREGYSDLFAINTKANEYSEQDVKNKLKVITQGSKSENVYGQMAKTFKRLCEYADFTVPTVQQPKSPEIEVKAERNDAPKEQPKIIHEETPKGGLKNSQLHYNIQIHLPDSRDQAVYDAIFKSLKEHLL